MVGIKPPSPQQIWRFSSAHFYREVISQINNLWYNILEVIIKGWVVDHRERAESIVSWSGLHLKYNAIFFYAGVEENASCQFFLQPCYRGLQHFSLPEYSENSGKCISITLSTHVETVVLLSKWMVDTRKVKVDFSLEDMDLSEFKGR